MSVNLGNLELTILQKISSASTPLEVQTYSKALEVLRNGNVYSVATFSELPTASENIGKLYYVADEETVYFYNETAHWVNISVNTALLMFSMGLNNVGQLGTGNIVCYSSPVREVSLSADWSFVSTGYSNFAGIKTNGTLWGSGSRNKFGAGSGSISSPVQELCSSTDWCWASSGLYDQGGGIKTDGTLWMWGFGRGGSFGNNIATGGSNCPTQEFSSSTNWRYVSAGYCRTAAMKTDGTIWVWGSPSFGHGIGDGTTCSFSSPVQEFCSATNWCYVTLRRRNTSAVKTNGTLWTWGEGHGSNLSNVCSPVQEFYSSTNWCGVESGGYSIAIKTDGTVWCSAGNSYTQEFCSATDWCLVGSMAREAFTAIKTDGTLWGWGWIRSGETGANTPNDITLNSPVQEITSSTNWYLVSTGWCNGNAIKSISL